MASEHLAAPCVRSLADGLPGRPWYKHVLQAPGLYTGYAARTLPGVDDAITAANWPLANAQAAVAAQRVAAAARFLDDLEEPPPPAGVHVPPTEGSQLGVGFLPSRLCDLFVLCVLLVGVAMLSHRRCTKRAGGGALQLPPELAMTAVRPMS